MIAGRKPQAGAYAERRYRQGLRNWRARILLICAAISGPFILGGIVVLVLWRHPLSWSAGAITGAALALWIAFRDAPPSYVEHWREGAEGERKTEKAVKPLERAGWRIVHDVQERYGNYDHVAVGRAGVFLLETKNLMGVVDLRNGVPHLRRRLDPEADTRCERIRPRALSAAARLKEDIERRTGRRTWVQAVVVLWSDFPQGLVDDGRCVFVHGSRLRAWMQNRPDRLGDVDVGEIAASIADDAANEANALVPSGLSPV